MLNEIRRICVLFFSATGTGKKVSSALGLRLQELFASEGFSAVSVKIIDFSLPDARKEVYSFSSDDLVICSVPTYAGRVPNLLLPFVKNNISGNNTPLIPIVMFGNRNYDDSLMELTKTLEDNAFVPVAAGAFVGEHSFSETLGAGRPDARDMLDVDTLASKGFEKLASFEISKLPSLTVGGCFPLRPYYTPRDRNGNHINILKVKPKTNDDCIECGHCASICTMGAISFDDPREVPGTCTKCCACVKSCPQNAKYYDDEGYLYHKSELEEIYAARSENSLFF